MKYLKSFPIFEDEISPMARDMFDLVHTFTIPIKWAGTMIQITGPIENKNSAESMEPEIRRTLEDSYYNMDYDPDRGIGSSEIEAILEPYENQLAKLGYEMRYHHNVF